MNLKPTRHSKMRRPPLPPILEIDEDGVPVSDLSFVEGRRFSGDDEEHRTCDGGTFSRSLMVPLNPKNRGEFGL